jgi:hypothetical protein
MFAVDLTAISDRMVSRPMWGSSAQAFLCLYASQRVTSGQRAQCCIGMPRKAATQARTRLAAGADASYGVDSEDEQGFDASESETEEHGAHEVQLSEMPPSY